MRTDLGRLVGVDTATQLVATICSNWYEYSTSLKQDAIGDFQNKKVFGTKEGVRLLKRTALGSKSNINYSTE